MVYSAFVETATCFSRMNAHKKFSEASGPSKILGYYSSLARSRTCKKKRNRRGAIFYAPLSPSYCAQAEGEISFLKERSDVVRGFPGCAVDRVQGGSLARCLVDGCGRMSCVLLLCGDVIRLW